MRREALREQLKGLEYLRQIERVDQVLQEGWRDMDGDQIAALRLRADLQFRRLAKVLPGLKAVELSGRGHHRRRSAREGARSNG